MKKYEVKNEHTRHSFGVYEADTPEHALDACCRDASYPSYASMLRFFGDSMRMTAEEVTDV